MEKFIELAEESARELITQEKVSGTANYLIRSKFRHPINSKYLYDKKILSFGALQDTFGVLIIPLQNINGAYRSFQRIYDDGSKSFLTGGQKLGCFFKIGEGKDKVIICIDYATAASIYECCKTPVVATIDANNLIKVAKEFRQKHGDSLMIIIAGDDDRFTENNAARLYAIRAVEAVNGVAVFPKFNLEDKDEKLSNFNDTHQKYGKKCVKEIFAKVINIDSEVCDVG